MANNEKLAPLEIWSFAEAYKTAPDATPLKIIADWICSYIVKPHLNLGRPGAVCPFVPHSVEIKALWLTVVSESVNSELEMCQIIKRYMGIYELLEPNTGDDKLFKTLILILPKITRQQSCCMVEQAKDAMKPDFVHAGLMLGEFFTDSASPGLHNPDFHPLCSPIPLFVYRQLVPDDLVFLTRNSDFQNGGFVLCRTIWS